jgi:hypothetical protein
MPRGLAQPGNPFSAPRTCSRRATGGEQLLDAGATVVALLFPGSDLAYQMFALADSAVQALAP